MFVNINTLCLVLSCVVFDAHSDGNKQNYLEKKVYAIESSLEADMHFLRKEVKENTEQMTKLVDLLNNTIQLVNSRSENDIVNKQPIYSDDQARGAMQHSDILQEIGKVASETSRNKRAIREEKQFAREVYSKLMTSMETLQTSLQESITAEKLFQEKSLETIQNEIASKFDEIKIQNDEIRQEIKVNTDETKKVAISNETLQTSLQESITRAELFQENLVKNLQNEMASKFDKIQNKFESNIEMIKTDVSLIKVTVLDTLEIDSIQNVSALCNCSDEVILERCNSLNKSGNETNISQTIQKDIRLSNKSNIPNGVQGRLEVYHSGVWGTVCDDYFNDVAATVACKHLGYANGKAHGESFSTSNIPSAVFGQGVGKIWMDNVRCSGSESSLFQCPMNKLGVEDCVHDEDVGVSCFK